MRTTSPASLTLKTMKRMTNTSYRRVGITEPIYGPGALQSVAEQVKESPYTELQKSDLKWEVMDSTNVETQTFYLTSDEGTIGMAQVIYSNVMGIRTTAQFNAKIFSKDTSKPHLWSSDPLNNVAFSDDKFNFRADNCSFTLSDDGNTYTLKSSTSQKCLVDLKVTKTAPGLVMGKNGTSTFGTDPTKPWGKMRHAFWPRCKVEGSMITQAGAVDFNGYGFFAHALQGMKPHHAAAKWNFCNFQSPSYSAVLMEYTTPPSYGTSTVAVGGILEDGKVIFASGGPEVQVKHTEIKKDAENEWPEPSAVQWSWEGTTKEGKSFKAELGGHLGLRTDKVDVMAEVPKFVKQIVAGAAGTKPYIYQVSTLIHAC